MSITERQRSHLTETATTVLGAEAADTLMALLPMDGWDNIVREPDLRAATAELRADMAELRNDVRTEISDVRTEITDVRTDITEFKAETRERFAQVDVQFADMRRLIVETNTSTRNWMLTSMVTITSVVTAIQLLLK